MGDFSRLGTEHIRALELLERDLGNQTFTWKGKEVACVPTGARIGQTVQIGGYLTEITQSLIVRKENFLTADSTLITVDTDLFTADSDMPQPVAGRTLIFRGRTWRILTAREDASRSHYSLDLGNPNR